MPIPVEPNSLQEQAQAAERSDTFADGALPASVIHSIATNKIPLDAIITQGHTTLEQWRGGSDVTTIQGKPIDPGTIVINGPTLTTDQVRDLLSPIRAEDIITAKITTKHAPLPVRGYTPQSAENVDLVNRGKEQEERVLRLIDELKSSGQKFDQRFVALGMSYVQLGFMLLYRSVFQPERIELPEDKAA